MSELTKSLISRFEHIKGRRDNWDTHFQELADYMLPRKADIVRKRSRGEKRMEMIFDGTALQAVDLFSFPSRYANQWGDPVVSFRYEGCHSRQG